MVDLIYRLRARKLMHHLNQPLISVENRQFSEEYLLMYNIVAMGLALNTYGTVGEVLYVCCLSILKRISMNFGKPKEQST